MIGNLKYLYSFDISRNKMNGRIPSSIGQYLNDVKLMHYFKYIALTGNLKYCTLLRLSNNTFRGTLPPTIGKHTSKQ